MKDIVNNIFLKNTDSFNQRALAVFKQQFNQNRLYNQWVRALGINPGKVSTINEIPFLPVSLFKDHRVASGSFEAEAVFTSSGTTTSVTSRHYVKDVSLYKQSFTQGFQLFYGDVSKWCIIGLLPSYLERTGSSLVLMVDELIRLSKHPQSGFYLSEWDKLHQVLQQVEERGQQTLLIGVTFALLDFALAYPMHLQHTTLMETGGMKGRKKELVRQEVHELIKTGFNVPQVHSEYGMTELLSQAYSKCNGLFKPVPWMKILVREEDDPMHVSAIGKGLINIIDLANVHSCSFIATDDVGHVNEDGSFEVLGRLDASDVRGCSLLAV